MKYAVCMTVVFLAVAITGGSAIAGHVEINATIDPSARMIMGTETVTFIPHGARAYFLLLANLDRYRNPYLSDRMIDQTYPDGFDPSLTMVEQVTMSYGNKEIKLPSTLLSLPPEFQTYSLTDTVLGVDLPQTASTITVHIKFSTKVPRTTAPDQTDNHGVITWRFGWAPLLILPQSDWSDRHGTLVYTGQGSFPLRIPALDYAGTITVPKGYTLVTGADYANEKDTNNGKVYELKNESETRGIAFALGKDYRSFTLQKSATTIEVDYLPGHDETARLFATYARDILREYASRFGPYPRKRLVIVEDPNRDGTSMAADGIAFISSRFFTHRDVTLPGIGNRLAEFVLAHEIAHQWWGIGVGVDMNAENWLSEGLAQYSAVSYFEGKYGATGPNLFPKFGAGIVENFITSQFGFLNLREHQIELPYILSVERGFDEALVKPLSAVKYGNATAERIYDKGYLAMREIETYLGGQKHFDSALWTLAKQYMHKEVSIATFEKVLGASSLKVLDPLFKEWVYGDGTVDYGVEITGRSRTHAGYKTTVAVSRAGGIPQPVVVEATLQDGKTVRKIWNSEKASDTLTFTTDKPVIRVTIDPEHLLPDRDRLNNNSPVKFVVALKKNAFPLDAYLIRPDPISQGVTISYLDRMRIHIEPGKVDANVAIGRSHYVSLTGKLKKNNLDLTASYTYLAFAKLTTGAASEYWAPVRAFTVGARREVTKTGPVSYFHFGVFALPTLNHSRESAITLDLIPSGAGKVTIGAFDELRILPQIYLRGTVTLGTGFGALPQALQFDRTEIHTFGKPKNGLLAPLHSYGMNKGYGRLGLELPLQDEFPYDLFGLAVVDHAVMRVFGAVSYTWNTESEFGKTVPNAEAGVEIAADLSAIGGMLPMHALVGYATPLLGEGVNVIYFGFSL